MPSKKSKSTRPTPRTQRPRTQREGRAAVVDNPKLPRMGDEGVRPRRIDRKIVRMEVDPAPSKARANTMDPVPKRSSKNQGAPSGDQVESTQVTAAHEGAGYVRLRLRMDDGELSVRGAKVVDGPLHSDEVVTPGLNYEATFQGRRLATGDVPDPTEIRSFPDPAGRPGLEGHHVAEQSTYEFLVRIPVERIDEGKLEELRVNLFRWRGKGPGDRIAAEELSKQPRAAVEMVGSLSGVRLAALSTADRRGLRRALEGSKPR